MAGLPPVDRLRRHRLSQVFAADGTTYEGREYQFVGLARASYDPTGHFLPSLDGMFDEFWDDPNDDNEDPDGADGLSEAQLGTLIDFLAWASVEFDLDPVEITGHRDHAATACPVSLVYEMIQPSEINDLVRDRIEAVDNDGAPVSNSRTRSSNCLEIFHNRQRRHSSLGMHTPINTKPSTATNPTHS